MFGAHVIVVEAVGFLAGEGQDLLCAWCKIVHHFCGVLLAPQWLPTSLAGFRTNATSRD
jgi:hypothetical protein